MSGQFDLLAERKLLIVTGKGGAGKSMLSVAMAHRLASTDKKVVLVEIGRKRDKSFTRLPEILGLKTLVHKPTPVNLGGAQFQAAILDPAQCLAEYVDLKLPTAGLAGMLLNNRVTSSFLEVVPGLPDLVTVGRIWHSLAKDPEGPDHIVLDAPATGHALALLQAPENFRKITRAGPIFKDASSMVEFLHDKEKTAIVLTSLPEEMSLQETLEAEALLKNFPQPFVYVNKCFPPLPKISGAEDALLWKTYQYSKIRAERESQALKDFKRKKETIPFFFPDPASPPLYQKISESLV